MELLYLICMSGHFAIIYSNFVCLGGFVCLCFGWLVGLGFCLVEKNGTVMAGVWPFIMR